MPSDDAYSKIPNLSGQSGAIEDIRSQGDPSRFFGSPRRGQIDAVTNRILDAPRFELTRAAPHNIGGTGAYNFIQWDTRNYDTDGMWDPAAPTDIKLKTPGIWLVSVGINWPTNIANNRVIGIIVNGAGYYSAKRDADQVANGSQELCVPVVINAGDVMQIGAAQGTGAIITLVSGVASSHDQHVTGYLASTFGSDNG